MKQSDRLLALLVVAGVGWYLYTRSKGLTLTGTYANPMLPAPARSPQSTVHPSTSTSAAFTNVFSGVTDALRSFVTRLSARPGNAPLVPAPSSVIDPANVASWGLQVPPNEPAPAISTEVPAGDPSLDVALPFWSMPGNVIPALPWTLNPATLGFDPNYIPPPPGS